MSISKRSRSKDMFDDYLILKHHPLQNEKDESPKTSKKIQRRKTSYETQISLKKIRVKSESKQKFLI